jgi:hypothetical protein
LLKDPRIAGALLSASIMGLIAVYGGNDDEVGMGYISCEHIRADLE